MKAPFFQQIAQLLQARKNCEESGNTEWFQRHSDKIKALVTEHCPHGSGFDNTTQLDFGQSTPERLVFDTSFHHMDEHGCYDGWTHHKVIVKASLWAGIDIRVTGRDRNQIKEYIAEQFNSLASVIVE